MSIKKDRAYREAVKVAEALDFVGVATPYVVAAIARAIRRETRRCLKAVAEFSYDLVSDPEYRPAGLIRKIKDGAK